ncbi:YtxH domain-containing protein [Cellulomonas chengniuliangii]|uniref:YtxH domain-containing protein n=1 Tax=Cellulomonas chengniuliangii TaxID=2968084 RepID=A0ABY5KY91_9CELL|nr:YtxH domain-containing protein [Cellulomonas chengniuliangii]MCC2307759.1 YtxH domain-containing protein [Cellulomonas chengniuliangii]MCC2318870.1 YtxH domain-containing protein [Cellulomonas chengniuliangii]UUI75485.1 YtxH domain-containing protein [Cellulomonas chengniuliangii]
MKGKAAFVLGAGLGYLLGTPSGREKLGTARSKLMDSWNDPRVQEKVGDIREKVTPGSSDDPWASTTETTDTAGSTPTASTTTSSPETPDLGGAGADYRPTAP